MFSKTWRRPNSSSQNLFSEKVPFYLSRHVNRHSFRILGKQQSVFSSWRYNVSSKFYIFYAVSKYKRLGLPFLQNVLRVVYCNQTFWRNYACWLKKISSNNKPFQKYGAHLHTFIPHFGRDLILVHRRFAQNLIGRDGSHLAISFIWHHTISTSPSGVHRRYCFFFNIAQHFVGTCCV